MRQRLGPAARWPLAVFWASLGLLTIFGVFILPLYFPPTTPTYSASYVVGFNNRIAATAVIVLSLGTAAVCSWWAKPGTENTQDGEDSMPLSWLLIACAATLLFVGVVGGLAVHTQSFESDAAYFLTQLAQRSHFHLKLYRDLEFGYGPLLFAWPAAFQAVLGRVNVGPECAYVVSLAALQIIGLGTAFYVVQSLPLGRSLKGWIFLALAIGAMRPSLGLNYTLFRFMAPFAALVFVTSVSGKLQQALLFALSELLMLSISSEIGIAFLAGVGLYAFYTAYGRGRSWLAVPVLPALTCMAFFASMDKGYFYTMRQFAGGMLNLVVGPTPDIFILLISAIALTPLAIASVTRRDRPHAGALVGLYGVSLALMPAALGLCDNLHTFFNGLGLYLLSFIGLAQWKGYWWKLAVGALLLIASPTQLQTIMAAVMTRHMREADLAREEKQVLVWEREADGGRIFAPVVPFHVRQRLLADDRLEPDYFSGLDNAFDPAGEEIKLEEMRRASFVLAPEGSLLPPTPDDRRRMRLLRFGYRYHIRRAAYLPLERLRTELLEHATPVKGSRPWQGFVLYGLR